MVKEKGQRELEEVEEESRKKTKALQDSFDSSDLQFQYYKLYIYM